MGSTGLHHVHACFDRLSELPSRYHKRQQTELPLVKVGEQLQKTCQKQAKDVNKSSTGAGGTGEQCQRVDLRVSRSTKLQRILPLARVAFSCTPRADLSFVCLHLQVRYSCR